MGGIAIYFHIEDVAAAGEGVIGSLDLGLVARAALLIYRYVVTVGVIVAVGNSLDDAEAVAVGTG